MARDFVAEPSPFGSSPSVSPADAATVSRAGEPPPRPLSSLTPQEIKWCSRRVCFLCEQRLSTDTCGGLFERCTQETMDRRRGNALATYRPRAPKIEARRAEMRSSSVEDESLVTVRSGAHE